VLGSIESGPLPAAPEASYDVSSPLRTRAHAWAVGRYGVLLGGLLLLAIAYPVAAERGPIDDWVPDLLFLIVLLSSLSSALRRKALLVGMIGLVLVNQFAKHAGVSVGMSPSGAFEVQLWSSMLFFSLTVGVILADVLRAGVVTVDRMLGAAAVYLLLALTFALAFTLVHHAQPGALTMPDAVRASLHERHAALSVFWYFSMTTLTTIGYGDIVPANALARGLATLEAAFGQLYLAIIVARLVSLQLMNQAPPPPGGPPV